MTLSELKTAYDSNIKAHKNKLDDLTTNEIVSLYLESNNKTEQDLCISYLVTRAWYLVQRIYYQKNNNILTTEDCYDIFMQTLHYVLSTHVWTNPESSLFEDEDGFIKAMAITIQSRRKNFLKAKYRQKRIVNETNFSLDSLEEDFQEGYFSSYEEDLDAINETDIEEQIKYYFRKKQYMASFILDAILNTNIFTDETNELDLRKLRKHIRNIDSAFCTYFTNKYKLNPKEVEHSLVYIQEPLQEKLDAKIGYALLCLKQDSIIKKLLDK